jgi:hypothetical protein
LSGAQKRSEIRADLRTLVELEAMDHKKSVLLVGIDPAMIDFSSPDFAASKLSADLVMSALLAENGRLRNLGYEADMCLTDLGETAERAVKDRLTAKAYDCVVIGAGIRVPPSSFLLFEKLINIVHSNAPQAKLCFNTRPGDTAEAVLRWV